MKHLVYCDDQSRFREKFIADHRSHYRIDPLENIGDLPEFLANMKKLPDLLLLDLYHPKSEGLQQEQLVAEAEGALERLDEEIAKTNESVLAAWNPAAVDMLRLLRDEYDVSQLPIAIFTQKGLLLLDDNELREVELRGADWLLKNRLAPTTERIWIDRIIQTAALRKKRSSVRLHRRLLVVSWVLIGVLIAGYFFDKNDWISLIAKTVGAIAAAGLAILINRSLDD